jgi:hypothetical protein
VLPAYSDRSVALFPEPGQAFPLLGRKSVHSKSHPDVICGWFMHNHLMNSTNSRSLKVGMKSVNQITEAKEFHSMKVYQVEYRAVITVEARDLQKAALDAAVAIKENPDLIPLRAAHEINPQSTWKHPRRLHLRKSSEKTPSAFLVAMPSMMFAR